MRTLLLSIYFLFSLISCRFDFLHQTMIDHLGHDHNPNCDHSIPLMSIGHITITKDQFDLLDEFKNNEFAFIVAITNFDKPEESCVFETFLQSLHQDFSNLNHTHNDKEIKILRIDANDVSGLREYERNTFKTAPSLFLVKNKRYFAYKGDFKRPQYLAFVNKVLNPYVTLTKDKEVEEFLDITHEYEELSGIYKLGFIPLNETNDTHRPKYRALLVLFERSNTPKIMRMWLETCENMANREDLRMGYLGDRARVQNFLRINKLKYNLGENKNLIILINDQQKYYVLDVDQNSNINLQEWINKNSLESVHEIKDVKDAKLLDMVKVPTLILFIDESQKSQFLLNSLYKIAAIYHNQLAFTYVKQPNLIELRYELGASQLSLPTVTIVSSKGIIYPFRNDEFNSETLEDYIKLFVTGRVRPINNEKFLLTIDEFVDRLLSNTKFISLTSFNQTVIDNTNQDVLVFFYSTEKDSQPNRKSQEIASQIDTTAQRFKDHGFTSVLVVSYDVYRNGIPEILIELDQPSLVLFPANSNTLFIQFDQTYHKTRSHMEFVEKHGSTGIKLTDRSHLPPRLVKFSDVQPGGKHYDPRNTDF